MPAIYLFKYILDIILLKKLKFWMKRFSLFAIITAYIGVIVGGKFGIKF
jgi:hypothetical protein